MKKFIKAMNESKLSEIDTLYLVLIFLFIFGLSTLTIIFNGFSFKPDNTNTNNETVKNIYLSDDLKFVDDPETLKNMIFYKDFGTNSFNALLDDKKTEQLKNDLYYELERGKIVSAVNLYEEMNDVFLFEAKLDPDFLSLVYSLDIYPYYLERGDMIKEINNPIVFANIFISKDYNDQLNFLEKNDNYIAVPSGKVFYPDMKTYKKYVENGSLIYEIEGSVYRNEFRDLKNEEILKIYIKEKEAGESFKIRNIENVTYPNGKLFIR